MSSRQKFLLQQPTLFRSVSQRIVPSLLSVFIKDYVRLRERPLSINFVSHSLGCLLTLEAIQLLRGTKNLEIDQVMLMAAAVPVGFCDMSLADGYLAPAGPNTEERVLYSLDDRVLKRYFKLGQWAAGELPKRSRRAVGRSGGPGTGRGKRWSGSQCIDGHDHGDYWNELESVEAFSDLVAPNVGISRHDLQRASLEKSSLSRDAKPERSKKSRKRLAHQPLF